MSTGPENLETTLMEQILSVPDAEGPARQAERQARTDRLQRAVFDKSRKLARSLSHHLGVSFEVQDFEALLTTSGVSCFQGEWSARPHARVLSRAGCDACPQSGAAACDYWREALDGLVVGLGDTERLARHASVRHGDAGCIDVFYAERSRKRDGDPAWGPLPDHMALDLLEATSLFRHRTDVE
ncbi:MAG TPA: hypothetical protein VKZ88_01120, partial [Fibrobacteria bacterium]|nr:hypothetical protein [Fibrobacteria bacterium]